MPRSRHEPQGFEAFLDEQSVDFPVFPGILGIETTPESDDTLGERKKRGVSLREGILISAIFHLVVVLTLVVEPDLLKGLQTQSPNRSAAIEEQRDPLVLFMEPPPSAPEVVPTPPTGETPAPSSPQSPPQVTEDRLVIPKATRPSPEPQDFQTDLPYSRGNTDEFYTDTEVEKPGEEGAPGEDREEGAESAERDVADEQDSAGSEAATEEGKKLASLLPPDLDFHFRVPREDAPTEGSSPGDGSVASAGEGGMDGEGGQFQEIQRFLRDKRFHNPEGGLVTGRDNTLYYNDKGANFVPWLRRMLNDVKRYWFASMPQSAAFQAGHVAVAVVILRDGKLGGLQVLVPSGISGFDNAAVGALRAADFLPLPSDYPDDRFEFVLVFWYNERPYDLF